MKTTTNRFGTGVLYEASDLEHGIYCVCTACMSVWSDFLSFANEKIRDVHSSHMSRQRSIDVTPEFIEKNPYEILNPTDAIVVLGCQVTDLAIYNDIETAKNLHKTYPNIPIYMGGCLAQRFDIELPEYIRRLDVVRSVYQELDYVNGFIDYQKPFWNRKLRDDDDELATGNLFRHMYPLKIGAGCHGRCKYCTIRDTRGESYETDAYLQVSEFLNHDDVVLISDSPTAKQIKDWCHIASRYQKPVSFRNVEPQVANTCKSELTNLAREGLLKIFHCPIQSNHKEVLLAMNRDVDGTLKYIDLAQNLRSLGTIAATNIIIDYPVDGTVIHNMDIKWLDSHFDYWSWNPYFDGNWDYEKAKERFKAYLGTD